jgi:hypothetical protein
VVLPLFRVRVSGPRRGRSPGPDSRVRRAHPGPGPREGDSGLRAAADAAARGVRPLERRHLRERQRARRREAAPRKEGAEQRDLDRGLARKRLGR